MYIGQVKRKTICQRHKYKKYQKEKKIVVSKS